jgi:hypothetical protein
MQGTMEGERIKGKGARRAPRRTLTLAVALAAVSALLCAIAVAASSAAKLEIVAIHGPTNVPRTETVPDEYTYFIEEAASEIRPNVGRYKIEIELHEKTVKTGPIRFDASPATVQAALEEVKAIGSNVTVTGGPQSPTEKSWSYTVTFGGDLAGLVPEVLVDELEPTGAEEKEVLGKGEEVEEPSYEFPTEPARRGQRDSVNLQLLVSNLSASPTSGAITVTDTLPEGLTTAEGAEGAGWSCKPTTEGKSVVKCTTEKVINPGALAPTILIPAVVDIGKVSDGEQLTNKATVAWEGFTSPAEMGQDQIPISESSLPFGVHRFAAHALGSNGEEFKVAGGHPYLATTAFFFNERNFFNVANEEVEIISAGNIKDANVTLPEGFVGNPVGGRKRCTQAEFISGDVGAPGSSKPNPENPTEFVSTGCPPDSQVGVVNAFVKGFGERPNRIPIYNLVPPKGVPAEFGFVFENIVPVRLDAHVARVDGKYKVTVLSADINEAFNLNGISVTLWGTPADPSHDAERNQVNHQKLGEASHEEPKRPFLTNPTDCLQQAEAAPVTTLQYDSWQRPGAENADGLPELKDPSWQEVSASSLAVEGCQNLTFAPETSFVPRKAEAPETASDNGTSRASAPSGYEFKLRIPQKEELGTLATPQLKDTTVTLPPGVSLSPSAANGLEACTPEEIDLDSTRRGHCPAASQVGEVHITSALLEEELKGRVYVGQPTCEHEVCTPADAQQGKLIHLYIEAEAENAGVRVKLPGNASIDQQTGVVTSSFTENPQVPFTTLRLTLKAGERASLANPQLCGQYTTNVVLRPWDIAGKTLEGKEILGGQDVTQSSSFNIDYDGAGGGCPQAGLPFSPSFVAGTLNPEAGRYSQFDTVFARGDDREQAFSASQGIVVQTPVGLLGKIAGVTKCEGEALEKLLNETGTCPANSRIATATSAAGPGREPFVASGPVFLTGGYKSPITGAEGPFGLAIAVPAKTKAFNLGTVVVRAAISINPQTSAITITSDPPPLAKDGIPLRVKQISVSVDRPEFMFNPTNCERREIKATMAGQPAGGEAAGTATLSAPFQATGCGALPFAPRFSATTSGKTSKLLGTSFAVRVEEKPGEANIGKVELQLPINLPSRLETLQEACDAAVFEANPANCPAHAVVGNATAHTPLLNAPLQGPAYLVSHANLSFPDVVFLLQGEGVHIELVGHTDIKNSITYSKFETVPDAPISSFETVFPNGRYSILGAVGNLCELELKAPTTIISQSNKRFEQMTPVAVDECGPTVRITSVKATAGSLLVTVKTTGGGTIKISGRGLKTTSVSGLSRGTKQIRVRLNRSGLALARHKKKIKLTATVTAGGQHATSTAQVKA